MFKLLSYITGFILIISQANAIENRGYQNNSKEIKAASFNTSN